MLTHFPIVQPDELLGSLLARFVQQLGVKDDKVALDILFGNRMIIPSPYLQGHIGELFNQVKHVWDIQPTDLIESHTLLPLFRSFMPHNRYCMLLDDLINGHVNPSMSRAGINASLIRWPTSYKICPQCWKEQINLFGFTYWQRLFQCPGITVCPSHRCYLLDTNLPIYSYHRHQFVGTKDYQYSGGLSEAAKPLELKLASLIEELINTNIKPVSIEEWSIYYQKLARDFGLMKGARIDHVAIGNIVQKQWSYQWLQQQGLALNGSNTWLLAMFRKHRRGFSYLQHFIVWISFHGLSVDLFHEFDCARFFFREGNSLIQKKHKIKIEKRDESRSLWLGIIYSSKTLSLKEIRTTILGARLYSWLYRYDREWLHLHKTVMAHNHQNKRVDWQVRDLKLAKMLIDLKNKSEDRLADPRHSKSWFASRIKQKSLIEKKLYKLPLCRLFFDRYSESIEEYQTRRLAYVMNHLIEKKDYLRPICEIERDAGLSHQRSRKPAREILRLDIPAWQRIKAFPRKSATYSDRSNSNQTSFK